MRSGEEYEREEWTRNDSKIVIVGATVFVFFFAVVTKFLDIKDDWNGITQKGEYWVLNKTPESGDDSIIFKGEKIGKTGFGYKVFKTEANNRILYKKEDGRVYYMIISGDSWEIKQNESRLTEGDKKRILKSLAGIDPGFASWYQQKFVSHTVIK